MGRLHSRSPRYRIAPDFALERFGDSGVVLLAFRNKWINVNGFAASLLAELLKDFGESEFCRETLAGFLLGHYTLTKKEAGDKAGSLLSEWTRCGILLRAGKYAPGNSLGPA
jgi:hypothetical protein